MELGFDLGAIGEREAEAAEDLDRAVLDDCQRMKCSAGKGAGGERGVEIGDGTGISGVLQGLLLGLKGSANRLAGGIESSAEFGFFLVGEVAHFAGQCVERAFLAQELHAGVLKNRLRGGGFDGGEGFGLDLCGLLLHGGEMVIGKK